jgi:hypothetical protein
VNSANASDCCSGLFFFLTLNPSPASVRRWVRTSFTIFPAKTVASRSRLVRMITCAASKSIAAGNATTQLGQKGFGKGGLSGYERKMASEKRNPIQTAARKLVDAAIKRGDVVRHPCFVCGEKKVEGHHWDYGRPLSVFWLCRKDHVAAHDGLIWLPLPKKKAKVRAEMWPRGRRCRHRRKHGTPSFR